MKISSKGDYALRTLLTLSIRNGEKAPVRLPEIAEQNKIPVKFLEQIMIQLKGAGLVTSRRGRHGGYLLARRPSDITIGEVIRLIDGTIAPVSCVSSTDYISCTLESHCVLMKVFGDIRKRIEEVVDHVTFGDLSDMIQKKEPGIPKEAQGEPIRRSACGSSVKLV
jgi:Rrf2 family protein